MRINKLFLTVSIVLALSLLLGACAPAPTPAPAAPATEAPVKKVKVLLLTEDPIGVNPYFITASEGLKKAAQDLGIETKVIESNGDATNMDENLRAAAREDYNLIILMTFGFNDTLRLVAPTTPDKFYVCVDCGVDLTGLTNVRDVGFKSHEAAYLLGIAAARLSKTGTIGGVGPVEMPFMQRWLIPFYQGAKTVKPDIKTLDTLWVGSWADPAKAKELALTLSGKGADVINGTAAAGNPGIFEAAKEKNFITTGVDVNECPKAPGLLIDSVVKRVDLVVYNSIKDFLGKTLKPGAVELGIKDGGVDLAVFAWPDTKTQCILQDKPDILKEVGDARQKIISGEIQVADPMTAK